jgi:ATP-dependent DNA helicase RecQ
VPDFAQRVATKLDLSFIPLIKVVKDYPPQKEMLNNTFQLENIREAFQLIQTPPISPVILIDDIVDSRWTLTYLGILLQDSGVPEVYPFVLAKASKQN